MSLLLTIGPEYRGGMFLYHNAEKSADLFEKMILSKIECETIKLRGSNSTATNIVSTITELSKRNDLKRIFIYYSGHGDHCGNKEHWQTSSGNVDQIKMAQLINNLKPLVVVISDSCSSEHMINTKFATHPYVSIGATKDYEDAMMTGDGGLFTLFMKECFDELDSNFTFIDLVDKLQSKKIEVEHFSILSSDVSLLNEKFFN